jgi:predicted outer membrane repeat protein
MNSLFSNNQASQGYHSGDGGAVHFDGSTGADFTVLNTRFIDNSVGSGEGGAIYASLDGDQVFGTGIMTVDKSTFTGNYAGQDGGAINHDANWSQTTLISVTNSTFTNNTAESDGGAIDMTDAAFVSGNRFVNNTALFDNAGALQLNEQGQTGRSIVTKNTFENNVAGNAPGFKSVTSDGGAIEFDDEVGITNNVFVRNRVVGSLYSDGGAIAGSGFDTTLSGNSFLYNSATGDGGAVYLYDFSYDYAKSKISGNTFDSNAAGLNGGAMWIDDNEALNDFKAQISDNRILRNTATYGAGLYITWAAGAPRYNAPTGILKNVFERNVASVNGGAIMIEYYGGAYRDARAAQQSLLKATKNNRYVANKANRDRSTATVGGWNVGMAPGVADYETADAPEARKVHKGAGAKVEK